MALDVLHESVDSSPVRPYNLHASNTSRRPTLRAANAHPCAPNYQTLPVQASAIQAGLACHGGRARVAQTVRRNTAQLGGSEQMRRRFAKYTLIGLAFGILDWYYLNALPTLSWGRLGESLLVIPIIIFLNYGVWLLVVVPVAIYEARRSQGLRISALAGATVWASAILSYYLYYTVLLAFFGLPHMDHLLLTNRNAPGFWQEWSVAFNRIIVSQFLEWIVIAMVGGCAAGFLAGYLFRSKGRRKVASEVG
jgi:hypothetical protein